jgi:hypothetical protein
MEQLIVLDLSDCSVHFYNIASDYEPDMEDLLDRLGHHASNCSWMFCENVNVEFHSGIINADNRSR